MKTNLQTLRCWKIANGEESKPRYPGLDSGPHTWDDLLEVEELKTKYEREKDETKQDKILEVIKNRVKDYIDWDTRSTSGISFVSSKLFETTRDSVGIKNSLKELWDAIEMTMGQSRASHFVREMDTICDGTKRNRLSAWNTRFTTKEERELDGATRLKPLTAQTTMVT